MRTMVDAVSSLVIMLLAAFAVAAYLAVNLMFAEVDVYWSGGCASIPVLLFLVAAIRNGLRFTIGWSLGLFALTFVSFICYGMDAGVGSFLLAGVAACVWMGVLISWALAYRPENGMMGAMVRSASGAVTSFRGAGRSTSGDATPRNTTPPGINLMSVTVVALLSANLVVSLMGVLV